MKKYNSKNDECYYCKVNLVSNLAHNGKTKDHLKPKSWGGRLSDGWVWACRRCNTKRGASHHMQFLFFINKLGITRAKTPANGNPYILSADKYIYGAARKIVKFNQGEEDG